MCVVKGYSRPLARGAALPYAFAWESSYQGEIDFKVFGDGNPYEIRVRRSVDDFERSLSRLDDVRWQREVVASIGLVRRAHGAREAIPPAVVAAFNRWQMAEWEAAQQLLIGIPPRPADAAWREVVAAPTLVRGARLLGEWPSPGSWLVTCDGRGNACAVPAGWEAVEA